MAAEDVGNQELGLPSFGPNNEQQSTIHKPSRRKLMGAAYRNLNVYGFGSETDYQKTFINYPLMYFGRFHSFLTRRPERRIDILQDVDGLNNSGELLLVLGRPGSGCSTLLKTLAGQTDGICVDYSSLNYHGEITACYVSMTRNV